MRAWYCRWLITSNIFPESVQVITEGDQVMPIKLITGQIGTWVIINWMVFHRACSELRVALPVRAAYHWISFMCICWSVHLSIFLTTTILLTPNLAGLLPRAQVATCTEVAACTSIPSAPLILPLEINDGSLSAAAEDPAGQVVWFEGRGNLLF